MVNKAGDAKQVTAAYLAGLVRVSWTKAKLVMRRMGWKKEKSIGDKIKKLMRVGWIRAKLVMRGNNITSWGWAERRQSW